MGLCPPRGTLRKPLLPVLSFSLSSARSRIFLSLVFTNRSLCGGESTWVIVTIVVIWSVRGGGGIKESPHEVVSHLNSPLAPSPLTPPISIMKALMFIETVTKSLEVQFRINKKAHWAF